MTVDILADIREQPERLRLALREHLAPSSPLEEAARLVVAPGIRRILLTGMGSSFYACYPAFLRLLRAGYPVSWVELSELLHFGSGLLDRRTLLIVVSQSGETVEARRLLEERDPDGPVVAVTNSPGSAVARRATVVVPIVAGPEQTVATKSYTTTLLALWLLAERAAGEAAADLAAALEPTIDVVARTCGAGEALLALPAAWLAPGPVTLVGRGPSYATALAGALLLKETAKLQAEGLSSAQFRHGPIEIAGPDHRAIVCAGSGPTCRLDARLAAELAAHGSQVLLLGPVDAAPEGVVALALPDVSLPPLVEIVPLQLLARQIALEQGIAPGSFRYGSKVTTAE